MKKVFKRIIAITVATVSALTMAMSASAVIIDKVGSYDGTYTRMVYSTNADSDSSFRKASNVAIFKSSNRYISSNVTIYNGNGASLGSNTQYSSTLSYGDILAPSKTIYNTAANYATSTVKVYKTTTPSEIIETETRSLNIKP